MAAGAALVASAGRRGRIRGRGMVSPGVLTPPGDVDALVAALEPLIARSGVGRGGWGCVAGAARAWWKSSASMPRRMQSPAVYRTLV